MKQRTSARGRKGESSAPIIPSHEGLLTFVMRNLSESHSGMSDRERQRQSRFTRIERTTGKTSFTDIPTSATTSSDGASAFVASLAAAPADATEPITVGDAVLASSDSAEPADL